MQATQTNNATPIQIAQQIRGDVTDAQSNLQIDLRWNGARLEGRLGGWWFPERIDLERSPRGLIGTVSSRAVLLSVNVTLTGARLELLIGVRGFTHTVQLGLSDAPTGIWHGRDGLQTPIQFAQTASGWNAIVGQQRVNLNATASPDWVALSAATLSLVAQGEIAQAMLESLKALREQ